MAIDGATVVVGASNDGNTGTCSGCVGTGAAYVFRTTDGGATYDQVAKLTASDAAAGDAFGISVAIDGDTIVARSGSVYNDDGGSESGSAYVFRTSDGGASVPVEVATLTASDAAAYDYFGYSVAIASSTIVVGANRAGTGGVVYVFRTTDGGTTYGQVARLTAADAAWYFNFGVSVAIGGDTIVVGCGNTTTPNPPTSSARPTAAPRTARSPS